MSTVDYSYFDALIDSVLILNSEKGIVYCNESAATLLESSVKRLSRGKPVYDFITFSNPELFVMPDGQLGENEAVPMQELQYQLKQQEKSGKVQVSMQPFTEPDGSRRWIVLIRDVTIEEVLHAKHHEQLKQLEAYSKNLEQMVEERTLEVKRANEMLNAIMNSLGQGFLVFNREGVCSQFYTRACEEILEVVPAGKQIWDVLKLQGHDLETFKMWMGAVFEEHLPFDSMKELGPQSYNHSKGRHVKLDYFTLRGEDEKISNLVLVASDWTNEYLAQQALENEKRYARMVVKLVGSKRQFRQFVESVPLTVKECRQLALRPEFPHDVLFRLLHTLEGEAAIYSANSIWKAAREAQEYLEPLKRGEPNVDLERVRRDMAAGLDQLQNVFKQFISENQTLFDLAGLGKHDTIEIDRGNLRQIFHYLRTQGVRDEVVQYIEEQLLREPVVNYFRHYEDVVQTVADKLGRQVAPLRIEDGDVAICPEPFKELFSSFVHAFRNAVDHGIEPPEEREMAGKSREGQLVLKFSEFNREGTRWIRIELQDDGKGIFADELRKKLTSIYPDRDWMNVSDTDVIQHIFDSGLSTKGEVGEFSGRGIGMNAIKAEAEALGGKSWVESEPLKGTKLIVEVPDLPNAIKMSHSA